MTDDSNTINAEAVSIGDPWGPRYVRDNQQGLSQKQVLALGASRINPGRVATRSESGKQLSYVQAWDVKATLIKVFGYGGFSAEVLDSKILWMGEKPQQRKPENMNSVVIAQATVRLTIHATGAVYTETATGQNAQPDLGKAMDTAFKSAESDALKRAALYLGTQFGLSLYAGSKEDVCRPILEPTQQRLINEAAEAAAGTPDPDVSQMLERATTADPSIVAEDAEAEAAAFIPMGEDPTGETGVQS